MTFTWDGTFKTSVVTDSLYNATLYSTTPYFGMAWTAHNMNIYGSGVYTLVYVWTYGSLD